MFSHLSNDLEVVDFWIGQYNWLSSVFFLNRILSTNKEPTRKIGENERDLEKR